MKTSNYSWILFLILVIGTSCIDEIDIDIKSGEPRVVVFGWITNEVKPYEISIKFSNSFISKEAYPVVSGAEVYVLNRVQEKYDFVEKGRSGLYYSDPSQFVGQAGEQYQLHILKDGKSYVSEVADMPALPSIDFAFINFLADPKEFEVLPENENYFVSGFVEDDISVPNYYRWKISIDGVLQNQSQDMVLFDDQFTNGNRFVFDASNVRFTASQVPQLTHMSLSKPAYDYYKLLKNQSDISTLSPRTQPSLLIGNLYNADDDSEVILGFFGASVVHSIEVRP